MGHGNEVFNTFFINNIIL